MRSPRPHLTTLALLLGCLAFAAAACDSPAPARPSSPVITSPPIAAPSPPQAPPQPAPLAPALTPRASTTTDPAPQPIIAAPPIDPAHQALGLPLPQMPEPLKLQIDTPYEQAFLTSLSLSDLNAFVAHHFPTYTVTRFHTGAFRATPPNNDGVEVSVTARNAKSRLVSYRIVYPPDAPARELAALQAAAALHAQGLGPPVIALPGSTDDTIPPSEAPPLDADNPVTPPTPEPPATPHEVSP
jgi:hypothetical protein